MQPRGGLKFTSERGRPAGAVLPPSVSAHTVRQCQKLEITMDLKVTEARTEAAPAQAVPLPPAPEVGQQKKPASHLIPSMIVALTIAAVASLSIWDLVRGQPLLGQGEGQ